MEKTCPHCHKLTNTDYMFTTFDNAILCQECYNTQTTTCNECGITWYSKESLQWDDHEQEWFCTDCNDSRGVK